LENPKEKGQVREHFLVQRPSHKYSLYQKGIEPFIPNPVIWELNPLRRPAV
jgi:hypothetical protein